MEDEPLVLVVSSEGAAPGANSSLARGSPTKMTSAYDYIDSVCNQKVENFLIFENKSRIERVGGVFTP
jgi:hypothetical protein